MKTFSSLLILSTVLTVTAFAADTGSGKIHLFDTVKIGSTELPAGDYKVTWNGTGDNAQVTLKQGKNVTETTAQVIQQHRKNDGVATKDENGARVLTEIQFRETTLVIQPGPTETSGR